MPNHPKESLWYLCTPYSKFHAGLQAAFEEACRNAALLIHAGIIVYSPIAHSHPIANIYSIATIGRDRLPTDFDFWERIDRAFIGVSYGCIVCCMQGIGDSVGVTSEIEMFRQMGKPIIRMTPGIIPDELR